MMILFQVLGFTGVLLFVLAWAIWLGFVRDYIRAHGQKPRSPFSLGMPGVWDEETGRAIARETGRTPWFLKLYRILAVVGILCFIAGIVTLFFIEE